MAVAQQQLEKIRVVNFDNASLTAGTTNSTVKSGERNYTVETVIANEMNADGTDLKQITSTPPPGFSGFPSWGKWSAR